MDRLAASMLTATDCCAAGWEAANLPERMSEVTQQRKRNQSGAHQRLNSRNGAQPAAGANIEFARLNHANPLAAVEPLNAQREDAHQAEEEGGQKRLHLQSRPAPQSAPCS